MLELHKLFSDLLDPQPGEIVLVLVDIPHGSIHDTKAWQQRRAMAERWHAALSSLGRQRGFIVPELVLFPATGTHNANLPAEGIQNGTPVSLEHLAEQATLILAMTQFSISAPLYSWTRRNPRLRAASMPLIAPEMEQTALAADYAQIARSCARLRERLDEADFAKITFSNGDTLTLDLRFRKAHADDGQLQPGQPNRLVNLPCGEAYKAVYEGERPNTPSRSRGVLPVEWRGTIVRLEIDGNLVTDVLGRGEAPDDLRDLLTIDAARRNVAELGLGCNPSARIWGNLLEDEKAGPHISLGRSEHLGGITGPDAFSDWRHIWHGTFIYAHTCAIHMADLTLVGSNGRSVQLISEGHYLKALEVGI